MNCPKCKTGRLHDSNAFGTMSTLGGGEQTSSCLRGFSCYVCGYYEDYQPKVMPKPSLFTIKKPIEETEAMRLVVANLPEIKKHRKKRVSFRAICLILGLGMNHTTLQKHYGRLMDGKWNYEASRRGRKKKVAA